MSKRIHVTSNDVFSKSEGAPQPGSGGEPEPGTERPPVPSTLDDHDMWENGVPRRLVQEIGKNAVRGAKSEAQQRGIGAMPGWLIVLVDNFLKSKVNWKRLLKSWVGNQVRVDWKRTRKRISRRFHSVAPDAFPGRKPVRSALVWVAVDNSGSVSEKELRQFFGELAGLLEVVTIILIVWDTRIVQVFEIKSKRQLIQVAQEIGGGGGTIVDNVFHALRHKGEAIEGIPGSRHLKTNPQGIIVLTDGGIGHYPPKEAAMGIPTLWAITRQEYVDLPKFGRKLLIEIDPDER